MGPVGSDTTPNPQVADEMRIRRLVVVDDAGRERIVAEVLADGTAELRVIVPDAPPGRTSGVTLVAGEAEGSGTIVSVHVAGDGDTQAEVYARRDAESWRGRVWAADPEIPAQGGHRNGSA